MRVPPCADGVRRGYPVESKLGTLYVKPLELDRVMVDNSSSTVPYREGRPTLTERGKEYTVSVNLKPDEHGHWKCSEHVHAHHAGTYDDPTPTTERNLVAAIEEAVTEWAKTGEAQALLAEAEAAWANNEVYRQREKVKEAEEVLALEQRRLLDTCERLDAAQKRVR
jgi:hypothetical protein